MIKEKIVAISLRRVISATYEILASLKKETLAKKISIFFFFIMGICVWGRYPLLKLVQLLAKEQAESNIRKHIPVKNLAVFVNPAMDKDIVWEEPGSEFHYKGTMYDVVKKERVKGNEVCYCYQDMNETDIFSCLEELASQLNENHSVPATVPVNLLKLLSAVFISPAKISLSFGTAWARVNPDFYFRRPAYSCVSIDVVSPPPKFHLP